MKIATWNINSIRTRADAVLEWLERVQPDLLFLQEIKCTDEQFPSLFAEHGWHAETVGQKAYNGVAVLSRTPLDVTTRGLPGLDGAVADQARYIEVAFRGLRAGGLYLPNGNSGGDGGFAGKIAFFDALAARARAFLEDDQDAIFLGDYNVCPTDEDYAPGALAPDDALVRPETRAAWRRLVWSGLTDAVRALRPSGRAYTFWDYQAGCWDRDRGLRIDHALLTPRVAERLQDVAIDRDARGRPQPSDHVPLVVTLGDD
jgi:exodeoxyribonuclease III